MYKTPEGVVIQTGGSVAKVLLANGMDANALRTNATLREDEWKDLDNAILDIARKRLPAVTDLMNRGLVYRVPGGFGKTVHQYEDMSDMTEAILSMDGLTPGERDRVVFQLKNLPLPITHKDYRINSRFLASSRFRGEPIDVTQARVASRKVAEFTENTLFNGASLYKFGGGILYGLTDFPQRNTVTFTKAWDDSSKTGNEIILDVLQMKQAKIDALHFGDSILYVSSDWETILDEDYKDEDSRTVKERLMAIVGVADIQISDYLTSEVILVELDEETIRMVEGMALNNVEWEGKGGMEMNFKVMQILVPQPRADQNGNSGIVHGSA